MEPNTEREAAMSEKNSNKPHRSFGIVEFIWRCLASLVLVLGSFNPSGYSYIHWVRDAFSGEGLGALHFFVGAVLVGAWAVFLVATSRSLGTLGTVITALVIGTLIWLLSDLGLVNVDSASAVAWLVLISLAIVLAIGLSWAHVWRRLSGQLEVDDTDD
jgi:hypothetical protein